MLGQGLKFSFISLCLAGASGCSSTETAADPNATIGMFCENWGKQACSSEVVRRCAGVDEVDTELTDSCVMSQRAFCEDLFPDKKGFSSQYASQCLKAVQSAYSDARLTALEIATVRHRGDPCNHLIKGPKSAGEDCTKDDDCNTLENYLCVLKSGQGSCRIPTIVENGDSCAAPGAACNPGYYCGLDEACVQSKVAGKTCAADFECATGLVCDSDTAKCTARVSTDKSCTQDDDCTTSVCDIPVGSTAGRCVSSITLATSSRLCEDLQ